MWVCGEATTKLGIISRKTCTSVCARKYQDKTSYAHTSACKCLIRIEDTSKYPCTVGYVNQNVDKVNICFGKQMRDAPNLQIDQTYVS